MSSTAEELCFSKQLHLSLSTLRTESLVRQADEEINYPVLP